jgi:hypothetical protein
MLAIGLLLACQCVTHGLLIGRHSKKLTPDLAALALALVMRISIKGRKILLFRENRVYHQAYQGRVIDGGGGGHEGAWRIKVLLS